MRSPPLPSLRFPRMVLYFRVVTRLLKSAYSDNAAISDMHDDHEISPTRDLYQRKRGFPFVSLFLFSEAQ